MAKSPRRPKRRRQLAKEDRLPAEFGHRGLPFAPATEIRQILRIAARIQSVFFQEALGDMVDEGSIEILPSEPNVSIRWDIG